MYCSIGKPMRDRRNVERSGVALRAHVTIEIPGRIDERIHRVGLAFGRVAALGTRDVQELGAIAQWRVSRAGDLDIQRQDHGQLRLRHRYDAARLAMDHRNRRAPIALPRHSPILQAIRNRSGTDAALFGLGDHLRLRFLPSSIPCTDRNSPQRRNRRTPHSQERHLM